MKKACVFQKQAQNLLYHIEFPTHIYKAVITRFVVKGWRLIYTVNEDYYYICGLDEETVLTLGVSCARRL